MIKELIYDLINEGYNILGLASENCIYKHSENNYYKILVIDNSGIIAEDVYFSEESRDEAMTEAIDFFNLEEL